MKICAPSSCTPLRVSEAIGSRTNTRCRFTNRNHEPITNSTNTIFFTHHPPVYPSLSQRAITPDTRAQPTQRPERVGSGLLYFRLYVRWLCCTAYAVTA